MKPLKVSLVTVGPSLQCVFVLLFFKFIFVFTYYYQVQLASSSMWFQVWVWKNAVLNTFSGINTENWNCKTGSQLNESGAGDSCLNNPFYLFLCLLTISLSVV